MINHQTSALELRVHLKQIHSLAAQAGELALRYERLADEINHHSLPQGMEADSIYGTPFVAVYNRTNPTEARVWHAGRDITSFVSQTVLDSAQMILWDAQARINSQKQ
jgi:hypothetical protein